MYDHEADLNYDCKSPPPLSPEILSRYHEQDYLLEDEPDEKEVSQAATRASASELLWRLWAVWFNPWWQPPR